MKKLFVLLVMAALIITGCDRQPVQPTSQNPYNGTKWSKAETVATGNFQYVLSFTENSYDYYVADVNGNFKYSVDAGTYSYSGNSISFSTNNQINRPSGVNNRLKRASVSGNIMTITYNTIYSSGGTYEYTETLMKN